MFVRNKSHVNDTTAFIALMSEKTVVINHTSDGWFVYPGRKQTEGTYAFCGGREDYEPLLSMLRSCGKEVTVNEE